MDLGRLSQGQKIAAAAGLVLLISLWFKWYSVDLGGVDDAFGGISVSANAWQAFGLIDLILFLTAIAAIAFAVLAASDRRLEVPVAPALVVAGLGALSTLLILYRLVNPPADDLSRSFGLFLGLIAAAAVTFGAFRASQEGPEAAYAGDARTGPDRARTGTGATTAAPPASAGADAPTAPAAPPAPVAPAAPETTAAPAAPDAPAPAEGQTAASPAPAHAPDERPPSGGSAPPA